MTWKIYGIYSFVLGHHWSWMTEWERQDVQQMLAAFMSLIVSLWKNIFFFLDWRKLGFFCFRKWMTITWSRDMIWRNCTQPGCGCCVMETLPRDNEWKLMTSCTSKQKCLIPAPLQKWGATEYPKYDSGSPSLTIGTLLSILNALPTNNPKTAE